MYPSRLLETVGRVCVAMELDPAYCDVIVERWQAFTGKKAVRDADKCWITTAQTGKSPSRANGWSSPGLTEPISRPAPSRLRAV